MSSVLDQTMQEKKTTHDAVTGMEDVSHIFGLIFARLIATSDVVYLFT
jgi:hypothetical protein